MGQLGPSGANLTRFSLQGALADATAELAAGAGLAQENAVLRAEVIYYGNDHLVTSSYYKYAPKIYD
jgi:hypothetical protein